MTTQQVQNNPWRELENGVLNMVLALYHKVLEDTGDKQYAMNYVRKYLQYMQNIILQIEEENNHDEETTE